MPPSFSAFLFAHGAGTGVAQVDEIIVRDVTVVPLNVNAGAGREIHLHRFGIGGRTGGLKRGLHGISIAQHRLSSMAFIVHSRTLPDETEHTVAASRPCAILQAASLS